MLAVEYRFRTEGSRDRLGSFTEVRLIEEQRLSRGHERANCDESEFVEVAGRRGSRERPQIGGIETVEQCVELSTTIRCRLWPNGGRGNDRVEIQK